MEMLLWELFVYLEFLIGEFLGAVAGGGQRLRSAAAAERGGGANHIRFSFVALLDFFLISWTK